MNKFLKISGVILFLVAFCGFKAKATYAITVATTSPVTTTTGASGTSTFYVTLSGGTFTYSGNQLWAVAANDKNNNPLIPSPFSSLSVQSAGYSTTPGATIASGTYQVVVSWTVDTASQLAANGLSTGNYGIYYNLFANDPSNNTINGGATDTVNIQPAAVPEPSQVVAASMLFGCAGLIFTGRRFMKKKRKNDSV